MAKKVHSFPKKNRFVTIDSAFRWNRLLVVCGCVRRFAIFWLFITSSTEPTRRHDRLGPHLYQSSVGACLPCLVIECNRFSLRRSRAARSFLQRQQQTSIGIFFISFHHPCWFVFCKDVTIHGLPIDVYYIHHQVPQQKDYFIKLGRENHSWRFYEKSK